jgi:hypothetical protein
VDSLNHYYNNHQHSILLYDDPRNRDSYLINYINEGLSKNELCIYGAIDLRDKESLEIASYIVDYEKNISEGNLMIVDLAPYYIAALTEDLKFFEKIKKEISERIQSRRKNKRIRFMSDCAGFLFENKHFVQCESLEAWWQHSKPFEGSCMCLYQKSFFEKYPFNLHKDYAIVKQHDNLIDTAESFFNKELIANETQEERKNSNVKISSNEDEKRGGLIN